MFVYSKSSDRCRDTARSRNTESLQQGTFFYFSSASETLKCVILNGRGDLLSTDLFTRRPNLQMCLPPEEPGLI